MNNTLFVRSYNINKAIGLTVSGGDVTISDNLIVTKNLTVNGDLTTIGTENTQVKDQIEVIPWHRNTNKRRWYFN